MKAEENKPNRPKKTDFYQQRLSVFPPPMSIFVKSILFFSLGVVLLAVGGPLITNANSIFEQVQLYDGSGVNSGCSISNRNQGLQCQISFTIDSDISEDLLLYYQLSNFYQNHRRYVSSFSIPQLQGNPSTSGLDLDCSPLMYNASLLLNPCGLVPNSFFNDVISLSPVSQAQGFSLDEGGISINYDYAQVSGFTSIQLSGLQSLDPYSVTCSSVGLPSTCKTYIEPKTNLSYKFYYPDDESTQYLYESYPQISPIDGVLDQHFQVWMRPSYLPTFRKLYGRIAGPFTSGQVLTFQIENNFEVLSFGGTKGLILTNLSAIGSKNPFVGQIIVIVGVFVMVSSVLMYLIQWKRDKMLLEDVRTQRAASRLY